MPRYMLPKVSMRGNKWGVECKDAHWELSAVLVLTRGRHHGR
jgi:hypothetical protein